MKVKKASSISHMKLPLWFLGFPTAVVLIVLGSYFFVPCLYFELKGFGQGIGAIIGLFGLAGAAFLNADQNRLRDERLAQNQSEALAESLIGVLGIARAKLSANEMLLKNEISILSQKSDAALPHGAVSRHLNTITVRFRSPPILHEFLKSQTHFPLRVIERLAACVDSIDDAQDAIIKLKALAPQSYTELLAHVRSTNVSVAFAVRYSGFALKELADFIGKTYPTDEQLNIDGAETDSI